MPVTSLIEAMCKGVKNFRRFVRAASMFIPQRVENTTLLVKCTSVYTVVFIIYQALQGCQDTHAWNTMLIKPKLQRKAIILKITKKGESPS